MSTQPETTVDMVSIEVNGIPLFHQLIINAFGADGVWMLSATVPSGLAGLDLGFIEPQRTIQDAEDRLAICRNERAQQDARRAPAVETTGRRLCIPRM